MCLRSRMRTNREQAGTPEHRYSHNKQLMLANATSGRTATKLIARWLQILAAFGTTADKGGRPPDERLYVSLFRDLESIFNLVQPCQR